MHRSGRTQKKLTVDVAFSKKIWKLRYKDKDERKAYLQSTLFCIADFCTMFIYLFKQKNMGENKTLPLYSQLQFLKIQT